MTTKTPIDSTKPLLEVRHLTVSFTQYNSTWSRRTIDTIKDLCVTVNAGEMVAVVGASGSGKSLLAHAILGILPYNATSSGDILYKGDILSDSDKAALRGREIFLVPQSVSYLDPLMKTGHQLKKGAIPKTSDKITNKISNKITNKSSDKPSSKSSITSIKEVFKRYGLPDNTEDLYPFELSGGMARRVLISGAVIGNPSLVIADEPTPGLHISVAKRVLSHFREIADDGAGVLLITHDLELAIQCADRIIVFYEGKTIEEVPASAFESADNLSHPYTKALYYAMPQNGFHSTVPK